MAINLKDTIQPRLMREFKLNQLITKRRYLLPKVRQGDYVTQELCNNHLRNLLMQWPFGEIGGLDREPNGYSYA